MKYVTLHRWFVVVAVVALVMTEVNSAIAQCECVTEASGFGGGDGSFPNPYQVCRPEHLDEVRNHLSSAFIQTADIDLAGYSFAPIGTQAAPFNGPYNGQNYSISNLTINLPAQDHVGLFGYTDIFAFVGTLRLVNFNVTGGDKVGAFIGTNYGLVDGVSATVTVNASGIAGGLIGENWGAISKASTQGSVTSALSSAGGLVGESMNNSGINNSYSTASVNAVGDGAGLAAAAFDDANVFNCYATGPVTAGLPGGLIRTLSPSALVSDCFWDTETSGQPTSAAGTGKTTAQMQTQTTFDPPWNFGTVWAIDEGNDYPRHQFETAECGADCACDDANVCNGTETCDAGTCLPGVDADAGLLCDLDGSPGTCDGNGNCVTGEPIPTVSEWGLAVMLLLTMTVGTLIISRKRPRQPA